MAQASMKAKISRRIFNTLTKQQQAYLCYIVLSRAVYRGLGRLCHWVVGLRTELLHTFLEALQLTDCVKQTFMLVLLQPVASVRV